MNEKLITTRELARRNKIEKSKIHFYVGMGLLRVSGIHGKSYLFQKEEADETLKRIATLQSGGAKIVEISRIIKRDDANKKGESQILSV